MSIEDAARASAGAADARVVGVEHSPDGRHGVVLLDHGRGAPVAVLCERTDDWAPAATLESPGWVRMGEAEEAPGGYPLWGEAEAGATRAVVGWREGEHPVPVQDGFFLFVAWDVPADEADRPRLIGFPG